MHFKAVRHVCLGLDWPRYVLVAQISFIMSNIETVVAAGAIYNFNALRKRKQRRAQ